MRLSHAILATLLIGMMPAAPRTIVVKGIVTDAQSGAPLSGVSITTGIRGASTDNAGAYSFSTATDDSTLSITFRRIGYERAVETRRLPRVGSDTLIVNVALKQAANQLSEIVVTATVEPLQRAKVPFSVARLDANGVPTSTAPVNIQLRAVAGFQANDREGNTEEYGRFEENPFLAVAGNPLSTFSADVDRASYANVRRFIRQGQLPPKGAVRIEELLNYFSYGYPSPAGAAPIAIHTDVADAPWHPGHKIVRIGLQAKRVDTDKLPPANLVFLIDVSGSMQGPTRLLLVKQGFRLLVDQLREQDRVAIVVYAGSAGLVLPSTPASDKQRIVEAIDRLEAGGSTAGGAGIKLAYQVALENYRRGANNRVILATDGDFNVGTSNTQELVDLVESKRGDGIFLTVLGFGMGNLKDSRMEQLADKGNGNYAYVDDLAEARKVFVAEFGGTLFTVAKDVKLQIEFNPATVQAYRLIGYENRALAREDFANDKKDAGEMGAGHTVTALYEIIPVGAALDVDPGSTQALKYQTVAARPARGTRHELMTVSVRYKAPDGDRSDKIEKAVSNDVSTSSADLRFAMAVAGYGMVLRASPHAGSFTYDAVLELASGARGDDREGYRADFIKLVMDTKPIALTVARRDQR